MADISENISQGAQNTIAGMNAVASTIGSKKDMERQAQYNKESMDYANSINVQNYERQLKDTYEMKLNEQRFQKQGLINAGLNPSWNEASGVVSTGAEIGASSSMPVEASHPYQRGMEAFMMTRQMFLQNQLLEAQAVKTAQEAKSVELANQGTEDANNVSTYYTKNDTIEENGVLLVKFGDDDYVPADQYPKTKQGMECLNQFRKVQAENYEYHSLQTKSELDNMVSRLQLNDSAVLRALTSMPEAMYNQIRASTNKTLVEKEILENEKYFIRNLDDASINSWEDMRKFLVSALYTFFGKK